jgi:cytochrome c oxidase subunit 2
MTTFDLVFDHEGTLLGHCAEFCGLRHSNMDFFVRVVAADEFRRWQGA